jgi:hypothetical protein
VNYKDLQLELEEAVHAEGAVLIEHLWPMLVSAQEAPDGIPRQLKEAAEQAAAELVSAAVLTFHAVNFQLPLSSWNGEEPIGHLQALVLGFDEKRITRRRCWVGWKFVKR